MSRPSPETESSHIIPRDRRAVLELIVNNHPGVMYHICGLFSRRSCNLEGILCLPIGDGHQSRMWLLLNSERRLEQIIKQVAKLEDVLNVRRCGDKPVFERLEELLTDAPKDQQSA